ncbi:MAG: hypothetical protein LUG13_07975 [Oscillospiraceae bacterium]|nr:hypothetical protein [Oscillospiraceae bacterium]
MELEHHDHACNCGHDHANEAAHSCDVFTDGQLNEAADGFLQLLKTHHFLPCARFVLKSTSEPAFSSVALAPVFISDGEESVSVLRAIGDILLGLEQHGYLSIDYDIPLDGFDYTYFKESRAYQLFVQTVREGKDRDGFLGDTATIEFGSIAPIE